MPFDRVVAIVSRERIPTSTSRKIPGGIGLVNLHFTIGGTTNSNGDRFVAFSLPKSGRGVEEDVLLLRTTVALYAPFGLGKQRSTRLIGLFHTKSEFFGKTRVQRTRPRSRRKRQPTYMFPRPESSQTIQHLCALSPTHHTRGRLSTRVRCGGGRSEHVCEAHGESAEEHGSVRREHGQRGGGRLFLQGSHANEGLLLACMCVSNCTNRLMQQ